MPSLEQPDQIDSFSLKTFFEDLSYANRLKLELDIFNSGDMPIEALEKITDPEASRGIMGRMKQYLEMEEQGTAKNILKSEAREIIELIEKQLE